MEENSVFVDSSVLIAAMLSSRGGSFYVLTRLKGRCEFYINEYVLSETMRVLDTKFSSGLDLKGKLFLLMGASGVRVLPNPTAWEVAAYVRVIEKEDAPILASAVQHTQFLLTLDNDFLQTKVTGLAEERGLIILKPRELIQHFRPEES